MGARDQLGRAGAAPRKLEESDLIGGGRAGIGRQIGARLKPMAKAAFRRRFTQQQQGLNPAGTQFIGEYVIPEQLMPARGDDKARRDLGGIGGQLQPAMAV